MKKFVLLPFVLMVLVAPMIPASEKPYITTQTAITLFSTQDGETESGLSFSNVKPYD